VTTAREPLAPRDPERRAGALVEAAGLAEGLERTSVREARFAGTRLGRLGLSDCVLEACDLGGLDAADASLVRTTVTASRLTGFSGVAVLLRDVVFRECRMDLATLRDARMERVRFERCDLRELDLQGTRLHDVRFEGCDLGDAILHGADCSRTELHDCSYPGLRGIDGLRGTTIAWSDALELAPAFAAQLGVTVLRD
jgi:uncharacterized protein YjbI with pentapeptide repeats